MINSCQCIWTYCIAFHNPYSSFYGSEDCSCSGCGCQISHHIFYDKKLRLQQKTFKQALCRELSGNKKILMCTCVWKRVTLIGWRSKSSNCSWGSRNSWGSRSRWASRNRQCSRSSWGCRTRLACAWRVENDESWKVLANVVCDPALILWHTGVNTRCVGISTAITPAGDTRLNPHRTLLAHHWTSRVSLQKDTVFLWKIY